MNQCRSFKEKQIILGTPTCASIRCKPSNINIQRKLSKQNIEKTNNNTSIAQKFLINRQNKVDYNKPKSAALAASNADKENFKKPRENLEEELIQLKWLLY